MTESEAKKKIDDFLSTTRSATQARLSVAEAMERFIMYSEQWLSDELPIGNDPQLTFNQTRDFVNIYLPKLFPRNPFTGAIELGVSSKEKDATKKEEYEEKILNTYEDNNMPFVLLEQGQNFFVFGVASLYYPFDPIARETKIYSINPLSCSVQFSSTGEVLAFAFEDEVSALEVSQDRSLFDRVKGLFSSASAPQQIAKAKRVTYWDTECQIVKIGDSAKYYPNTSGIVPFSWIPNLPASHSREGQSEGADLYHIDREYNFRASDIGKRVKENTRPNLVTMTDLDVDKLDRNDKGILPLQKDDDAKFLVVPEEKTGLAYLDKLEARMRFKMAINDAVLGQMRSNISADAMGYYFMPLLDRIALKRIAWDAAFKRLNSAILQNAFGAGKYRTSPVYHPALAVDASFRTDIISKQLDRHLISHVDAIDALHGSENANEKFSAILAEAKVIADNPGMIKTPAKEIPVTNPVP